MMQLVYGSFKGTFHILMSSNVTYMLTLKSSQKETKEYN